MTLERHRERARDVAEVLTSLAALAREVGATSLGERVERELCDKLLGGRFHLVVMGEFNHGKSTFVNALLGASVLPTGVTPTTAAIHHLVYSERARAAARLQSGEVAELPPSDVARYAVGGDSAAAPLRYLEVGVAADLLRDGVVLVDTPGVNDLSLTRAEITCDYVPRADAVLFVLDAGQPVKESERVFLEQQLLARSRDKIVFVVAKADIWSDAERAEALAWIEQRLSQLLPAPKVFAVSAQRALAGGDGGLAPLTAHLTTFLADERGKIVIGNVLGEARGAAELAARAIEARRHVAALDDAELARRIGLLEADLAGQRRTLEERRLALREEAAAIKAWARRDLEHFVADVVARLPASVAAASGEEVRTHLGPFLEGAFREWASAETAEMARAFEVLTERQLAWLREDEGQVGRRVAEALGEGVDVPRIQVDTFAQDVSVFAVFSLGLGVVFANVLLGGALLAAAPVLALWNKGRAEDAIRRQALDVAPAALREAASRVGPRLDELVDDYVARLETWLVSASEELHRELIQVLGGVRDERRRAAHDRVVELEHADRAAARLAELRGRLDALGASLL